VRIVGWLAVVPKVETFRKPEHKNGNSRARVRCPDNMQAGVENRPKELKGRTQKVASRGAYLWVVENKLVSSGLLGVRDAVVPVHCENLCDFQVR